MEFSPESWDGSCEEAEREEIVDVVADMIPLMPPKQKPAISRKRSASEMLLISSSSVAASPSPSPTSGFSSPQAPPRKKRSVSWSDFNSIRIDEHHFELARRFTCPQLVSRGICMAADLCSQNNVAIRKCAVEEEREMRGALRQLILSRAIGHESVLNVIEAYERNGYVYIITRVMDGAATEVVGERLSSFALAKLIHQLLSAAAAMHDCGLSHRSIDTQSVSVDVDVTARLQTYGEPLAKDADSGDEADERFRRADYYAIGSIMCQLMQLENDGTTPSVNDDPAARDVLDRLLAYPADVSALLASSSFFAEQPRKKRIASNISKEDRLKMACRPEQLLENVREELSRYTTLTAHFDFRMWCK